jgi:hypothetical protein
MLAALRAKGDMLADQPNEIGRVEDAVAIGIGGEDGHGRSSGAVLNRCADGERSAGGRGVSETKSSPIAHGWFDGEEWQQSPHGRLHPDPPTTRDVLHDLRAG